VKIKRVIRSLGNTLDANSPAILTGVGVAGVLSTVALAIKGTFSAAYVIFEEENLRGQEQYLPLTQREKLELVWKFYIPTAASSVLTIAAIIGSNHISMRRNAALLSLYSVADQALKEYQDKVVEMIGQKKEEKIRDEIAKDKLDNNPLDGREVIITGKGTCLFYDTLSGRYFRSDLETVRRIQNDFNELLFNDMFLPLNDLYDMLGLENTDMGRRAGWDVQNGKLEIQFSAKIATDGEPCIVLSYSVEPKYL
jgi:hypothetical protein